MKTIYFFLFFLVGTVAYTNAQSPVAEPDTLKNLKQTDPVPQTMPPDANYTAGKIKIITAEFPAAIKKTLSASSEYQGWEKGSAYKSKDGKMFFLEMSEADTTRIFRFDANGKLLLD
jgi:hypothetical protein